MACFVFFTDPWSKEVSFPALKSLFGIIFILSVVVGGAAFGSVDDLCNAINARLPMPNRRLIAVPRLHEAQPLRTALESDTQQNRDSLLEAILKSYDPLPYGNQVWPKADRDWNPSAELTWFDQLSKLDRRLHPIALDASLMTHLPEFLSFADGHPKQTIIQLRKGFRADQGTVEVWRSVALASDAEAQLIKETGFDSDLMRFLKAEQRMNLDTFESLFFLRSPSDFIDMHVYPAAYFYTSINPYISVSLRKQVASSVGKRFRNQNRPHVYLFKMLVPEADLIYFTPHAVRDYISKSAGKEVESFLPFRIDRNEILSVEKIP